MSLRWSRGAAIAAACLCLAGGLAWFLRDPDAPGRSAAPDGTTAPGPVAPGNAPAPEPSGVTARGGTVEVLVRGAPGDADESLRVALVQRSAVDGFLRAREASLPLDESLLRGVPRTLEGPCVPGTPAFLRGAPPGEYVVVAGPPGTVAAASRPVAVAEGATVRVELTLPSRSRFMVHVVRPDGLPAPGVALVLARRAAAGEIPSIAEAVTGAQGEAVFHGAVPGIADLLRPDGKSVDVLRRSVAVPEDSGLRITLFPSEPLTVLLVDASGRPVEGALVSFVGAGRPCTEVRGTTGAEGTLEFPSFPWSVPVAVLRVERKGSLPHEDFQVADRVARARSGHRLEYALPPTSAVRFAVSGAPPGATVFDVLLRRRLSNFSLDHEVRLDADLVVRGLPAGPYRFRLGARSAEGSPVAGEGQGAFEVPAGSSDVVVPVELSAFRDLAVSFVAPSGGTIALADAAMAVSAPAGAAAIEAPRPVPLGPGGSVRVPRGEVLLHGSGRDGEGKRWTFSARVPADAARADVPVTAAAAIRGTVVDAAGLPVHPATVRAAAEADVPPGLDATASTIAGPAGFELAGLAAGRWRVSASTPEHGEAATVVSVEPGAEAVAELRFPHGAVLTGTATLDTGEPAEGVLVQAVPSPQPGSRALRDPNARGGPCDRDGRFTIRHLAPQTYTLFATGRGVLPREVPGATPGTPVALVVERTISVTFRVRTPAPLLPQHCVLRLSGVTTLRGEPADLLAAGASPEAVPGPDGTATLDGLPRGGSADLHVGPGPGAPAGVGLFGRPIRCEDLQPGLREIDLEAAGPPLEGRVLDRAGQPLEGVTLHLGSPEAPPGASATARTDASGSFRVLAWPAVRTVTAQCSGPDVPTQQVTATVSQGPIEIRVSRGIRVTGAVLSPGSRPVAFASVNPLPAGQMASADADGRFDLLVPAETTALSARSTDAEGLLVGRAPVGPKGGRVELKLQRGTAYVECELAFADGTPVAGETVLLAGDPAAGETDRGGLVRIGPLVPGRYRLTIRGRDWEGAEVDTGGRSRVSVPR
jgi:hypothetical protein